MTTLFDSNRLPSEQSVKFHNKRKQGEQWIFAILSFSVKWIDIKIFEENI